MYIVFVCMTVEASSLCSSYLPCLHPPTARPFSSICATRDRTRTWSKMARFWFAMCGVRRPWEARGAQFSLRFFFSFFMSIDQIAFRQRLSEMEEPWHKWNMATSGQKRTSTTKNKNIQRSEHRFSIRNISFGCDFFLLPFHIRV